MEAKRLFTVFLRRKYVMATEPSDNLLASSPVAFVVLDPKSKHDIDPDSLAKTACTTYSLVVLIPDANDKVELAPSEAEIPVSVVASCPEQTDFS